MIQVDYSILEMHTRSTCNPMAMMTIIGCPEHASNATYNMHTGSLKPGGVLNVFFSKCWQCWQCWHNDKGTVNVLLHPHNASTYQAHNHHGREGWESLKSTETSCCFSLTRSAPFLWIPFYHVVPVHYIRWSAFLCLHSLVCLFVWRSRKRRS